jgi:hypothetical protein
LRIDTEVVKNKVVIKLVEKDKKPGVRATIDGGLAIYRVKFKDNQYSIVFAYEIRAKGSSMLLLFQPRITRRKFHLKIPPLLSLVLDL